MIFVISVWDLFLHQVWYALQFIFYVLEVGNLGFGLFEVEALRVVGVELFDGGTLCVAILEVLVVVEVAVVGGDSVEVAHVYGFSGFFFGEEGLVHLLSMTDADDTDFGFETCRGLVFEEVSYGFCLGLDGAGGSFLDKNVTVLTVLEGEEHEVNSFLQTHDEAGHLGFCQGDGVAFADLVYPKGYDAAAAAHDVAIAGAADLGVAAQSALGDCYLLLNGFGDAHGIDRVCGFVGRETDDALYACIDGGIKGIVGADDVGLDGFHREELAAGHLLQGSCMEHVVNTLHGIVQGATVADIADVELDLACHLGHAGLEVVAHVVLLFLVAAEDADLADVGFQETVKNCVTETAGASGDKEDFVFE